MSLNFNYGDDLDDTFDEEKGNDWTAKARIIFIIDGTPQMHENDSPFLQSLETYRNIVRSNCSRNKKDKMGVIVLGTKDSNCDVAHVTILQELESVTVDTLKKVQTILKERADTYKKISSNEKYSLYDTLTNAYQTLTSESTPNTYNTIVICTCNDNPCANDPAQRRRIQHLIATFKDTRTRLQVIGFSNSWDDEYYKDLQIIAGTFTDDSDYRRIKLNDLEHSVLNPSRSVNKLPWKITPEISIEVSVYNLVSHPIFPSKVKLEKGENKILDSRPVLRSLKFDNDSLEVDQSSFDEKTGEFGYRSAIVESDNIMYCKSYSDKTAYFTSEEVRKIKTLGLEPGIQILAFKRATVDPLYHVESAYFVSYTSLSDYESKSFFRTFVSKCYDKKVMAICRVVTKVAVKICTMIPSKKDGGFYMYKCPFTDAVRDLDKQLPHFVFNSEKPCKLSEKAVDLFKNLIEISKVKFDIKNFRNPKLEKCIAHIEALALDERLNELPPDSTLPPPKSEEAIPYVNELIKMFDLTEGNDNKIQPGSKENNARKRPKFDVVEMASKKSLHNLTVADLKDYLVSVHQSTAGNKSALIDRIYNYLQV